MDTTDDLLERVVRFDDEDAFQCIFREFYPPLCLLAGRIVPYSTAKDVVQEVFVTLWETRHTLEIETSLKGWLVASTRNRCFNYLKHLSVCNRYTEYYAGINAGITLNADDLLSVRELESRLEQVLDRMPEEWRVAFVMSRMNHQKTADIAQRLGVSERTVERFRNKAIQIIENELKDYMPILLLLFSHQLQS